MRAREAAGLSGLLLLGLGSAAMGLRGEERRAGTRLVGDWEAPDVFLVANETAWDVTVRALLEALVTETVEVLDEGVPTGAPVAGAGRDPGSHESPWVRDYGPIQLDADGRPRWLDPVYLPDRPGDDDMPRRLGRRYGVPVEPLPFRLEGGALASDGRGLCAITGSSLERANVAPDELADRIGCETLAVLPSLRSEPTGHVDLVVHFLGPGIAAVAELPGSAPGGVDASLDTSLVAENRRRLDAAAAALASAARSAGRTLEIVRVPVHWDGERFLSYVNLVDLEDRLLVPAFSTVPHALEAAAFDALRSATGKRIVPIPADGPGGAQGGIHCIVLGLHTTSD